MRRKLGFLAVLLGMVGLILAFIFYTVYWIGTDVELYGELQRKAGVLVTSGVSEEDLAVLDQALADCLNGENATLGLQVEVFGKMQKAFNEREITHMQDCQGLFRMLIAACQYAFFFGGILLIVGWILVWNRRKVRIACWIAPLVILIPLGAFAVWAIIDFNAAFTFFHTILFDNDYWLLDEKTDLLIRLCPESMFRRMGIRIAILSALSMFALPTAVSIVTSMRED